VQVVDGHLRCASDRHFGQYADCLGMFGQYPATTFSVASLSVWSSDPVMDESPEVFVGKPQRGREHQGTG
jgi:hypothetical protein